MRAITDAIDYMKRGAYLARQRPLRPWVIVPLMINVILLGILYYLSVQWVTGWIASVTADWQLGWGWANSVLNALIVVARVLIWVLALVVFSSLWTVVLQMIGAPFWGLLAEKVDYQTTGVPLPEESFPALTLRVFRRTVHMTWYWLWRAALVLIGLGILSLIPVVNILVPVLGYAFASWMMAMQYLDFCADNRQVSIPDMVAEMKQRRWLVLAFGAVVLGLTMIPLVNLVVMPVAVIAGTLLRVERLAPSAADSDPG